MSLTTLSLTELRQKLTSKEISPADLVRDVASAIEARNPQLGAYLTWDLDAALKAGEGRPLTDDEVARLLRAARLEANNHE